jgi:N-acetylglucosaminyldiphosphoundecaprenol N-acetyl-beta-D-mannosaminyltransferase
LFLLGARPGIADAVAAWVHAHYPRVKLAGFHHGYFAPEEEQLVLDEIRHSGASILLVALGAPRQDVWISRNLAATGVKVAMGVGGLFDFYSGRIPRAPQWLREMGLEWVYRLYREPGRMWRRYLVGNLAFLSHIALQRLRGRTGSPEILKGNTL